VRQERLYRTEGIVLRQLDYAETDRILTLLTPEGKLSALVHGIRRPTSRKAGHLGLFCRAQLLVARGRNLDIITQAEGLEEFEGLRGDLLRFTYACYVGELVERLAQEEDGDLYALTVDALRRIADEPDPRLWVRYFELRLLRYAGYQPELFRCLGCQEPIRPEANVFVVSEGGLFCPRCGAAPGRRGRTVSVTAQKVLRYLATRGPQEVGGLRVSERTHAEVEALLYAYLEYTLERELKSVAFLQRLRRELHGSSAGRQLAEQP